jgi:superfamily I DNA/RNA helicase
VAKYASPTCPDCGGAMALREGKYGPFWGCTNYPTCRGMAKATTEDRKRVVGKRSNSPSLLEGSGHVPTFKPLPQQSAIITHLINSKNSLKVVAYAGAGKSSTAKLALHGFMSRYPRKKVLAATQGKRITQEFAHGAPTATRIQTWHSFGYAQIRNWAQNPTDADGKRLSPLKIALNGKKVENILDTLLPLHDEKQLRRKLSDEERAENGLTLHFRRAVKEAVRLCKSFMLTGSRAELDYLFGRFTSIDTSGGAGEICYDLVPQVLRINNSYNGIVKYGIDFTDMIYLPSALEMPIEQFDLNVVDEAQDLNTAQQFLAIGATAEGGKILFIGDPFQAIMGFTGADVDSMDNFETMIKDTIGDVDTLPLTISLRCTKSAARLARTIVEDFDVLPNAKEGILRVIDEEQLYAMEDVLVPGTMVTSRMNAPLLRLAWQLTKMRVPVKVQGIDFAEGLKYLVVKSRCIHTKDLLVWLDKWAEHELDRLAKKKDGGGAQAELVADKKDCLVTLAEGTTYVHQIETIIDELFTDLDPESGTQRDFVVLSSIHRAKGLEATKVVCWPAHGPHPLAKQDWEVRQEMHLLYVQWTRVKQDANNEGELYIVRDKKAGVPQQVHRALAA